MSGSLEHVFDDRYTRLMSAVCRGRCWTCAVRPARDRWARRCAGPRSTRGAWVDLRPGWIAGADALFERLVATVPWRAERRHMYDRVVEVPRLLCFYDEGQPLPDPVLDDARPRWTTTTRAELGEPFRTAGLCLYRDGRDSVAWHGDTIGRGSTQDTMVAIVSLGAPRSLLLRPRGGGRAAAP